jgi:hypothetical protein
MASNQLRKKLHLISFSKLVTFKRESTCYPLLENSYPYTVVCVFTDLQKRS